MVGPDNALISMRSPKMDGSMEIINANTDQIVGTFTPFPRYNGAVHLLKGIFMGDGNIKFSDRLEPDAASSNSHKTTANMGQTSGFELIDFGI